MSADSFLLINSLLFGVGLAIDAFLVALASGLNCPKTRLVKVFGCASVFSVFQFAATIVGWAVAYIAFEKFGWIEEFFSWLAIAVIAFLGIKMIIEAARKNNDTGNGVTQKVERVGFLSVVAQSAATSVDALTVGFTIEEYGALSAVVCALVIAAVTFVLYSTGFFVGRKFGMRFNKAASVIGGLVFLAIAVEILLTTYVW